MAFENKTFSSEDALYADDMNNIMEGIVEAKNAAVGEVEATINEDAGTSTNTLTIVVKDTNGNELATTEVTLPSGGGGSVDLSGYIKKTDVPDTNVAAGVKIPWGNSTGILYHAGDAKPTLGNSENLIKNRSGNNAIRNIDLDFTIVDGLENNRRILSTEQKLKIKKWLGETNYELIEKIVIGYSITTSQPTDWETNYTAYFTNTGTDRVPVYAAVAEDSAPTWEAGKYYSFDSTTQVKFNRTTECDGTPYSFKKVLFYSYADVGTQVNGYFVAAAKTETTDITRQVNVSRFAQTGSVTYTYARAEIDHGNLVMSGSYTGGVYSLGVGNLGSIQNFKNENLTCKTIYRLEGSDKLNPNTEIYIYAVRA